MTQFNYDDVVRVSLSAPNEFRPGSKAWVIGITLNQDRHGIHFNQFTKGVIYLIEYENGEAIDIHESYLELFENSPS